MKTTIDIPDDLFRQVESLAALRGVSLRELVTETLRDRLVTAGHGTGAVDPPWMKGFGGLAALSEETRRIEGLIAEEFEQTEKEP